MVFTNSNREQSGKESPKRKPARSSSSPHPSPNRWVFSASNLSGVWGPKAAATLSPKKPSADSEKLRYGAAPRGAEIRLSISL